MKKSTPVKFTYIQDGYESFSLAVSDLKDTFYGLYIFYTRSQGVAALVSVSDGKIQITILILRRGPCLLKTCSMESNSIEHLLQQAENKDMVKSMVTINLYVAPTW